MAAPSEPRNPFYMLMLIVGLIFIMTIFAYLLVPWMEQKALDAGTRPPPREESWPRTLLHDHGVMLVLGEVALLVILGFASMGLDRYRRYQQERDNPPPVV